jgi:hypothetical protein
MMEKPFFSLYKIIGRVKNAPLSIIPQFDEKRLHLPYPKAKTEIPIHEILSVWVYRTFPLVCPNAPYYPKSEKCFYPKILSK